MGLADKIGLVISAYSVSYLFVLVGCRLSLAATDEYEKMTAMHTLGTMLALYAALFYIHHSMDLAIRRCLCIISKGA